MFSGVRVGGWLESDDDLKYIQQWCGTSMLVMQKTACCIIYSSDSNLQRDIIVPAETSTMLVVKKPSGKLCICIVPKPLSWVLKKFHYSLPTSDDMLPELSKASIFTVCDVKNRFWHIRLNQESTTFATRFGCFRWLRVPMRIQKCCKGN